MNDSACTAIRQQLSMQRDGLRTAGEASSRAHVARCAACARFERDLAELTPLFDSLRGLEPPPALIETLSARLARRPSTRMRTWLPRAAAASIGFLAVSGLARLVDAPATRPGSEALAFVARAGRSLASRAELHPLPERELLAHLSAVKETR